jgi:hypothetical protein
MESAVNHFRSFVHGYDKTYPDDPSFFEFLLEEYIKTCGIVTFKTNYHTIQVIEHGDSTFKPSTTLRRRITSKTFQPEMTRSNL